MNKAALCVAAGFCLLTVLAATSRADSVVLEDAQVKATFDSANGALTGLERKQPHWVIERRPELGMSFRLLAPMPNQRDNFVLGEKQKAASCQKVNDHQVRIVWKDLQSEHGGTLPMVFTATITLGNGQLTFDATLDNQSKLAVETIDYPYFGDFNPVTKHDGMQYRNMWYGNLVSTELYPKFENAKGYWGVMYPTKMFESRASLFGLIQCDKQGVYVGMRDPTQPYLVEYTFEQHPGVVSGIGTAVPKGDEISGLPVFLQFRACHYVYAQPGKTTTLAPIVLQAYDGDWHAGVDLYKTWRNTWFKQPHFPSWVMDINSWLQLQINTPEEDWRVPYKQLVQYGQECADNGVAAIQLVGWNKGGQDRGDPAQDTDPGLGTWQDLHDAIQQIQAKGVKMILFAKLNWADRSTDWYKTELHKYEMLDPYGYPYEQPGYGYITPTQLAGINNRRRSIMDFTNPEYRNIATKEFQKILALGAQGWLWDEVCHHGNALYNFPPGEPENPSGYVYNGDLPIAAQLRAAADKVNPDFLFSGEGPQDWLMQYFGSYFRINSGSTPVARYVDSQAPLIVAVTGINDREMLNLCLLDRYIIEYEPYNFKGHVTDFPLTLEYGKKIDVLRRKYRSYLWDAEFRDNQGAQVKADGGSLKFTVFRRPDGKRAVVIANMDPNKAMSATVSLPNAGALMTATPEDQEAKACSGTVQIPARSAAAVMEQ